MISKTHLLAGMAMMFILIVTCGCSKKESTFVRTNKLKSLKGKKIITIIRTDRYILSGDLSEKKVILKGYKAERKGITLGLGLEANDAPIVALAFSLSIADNLQDSLSKHFKPLIYSNESVLDVPLKQLVYNGNPFSLSIVKNLQDSLYNTPQKLGA